MFKNLQSFKPAELEEKILKFWKENQIFEKSLAKNRKKKKFIFYEGPPSANAMPHLGHVESRVFKDIILRYKIMKGFNVERRAGWDTHGLPIEVQTEKELGFKNKQDIEKLGIDLFNKRCKELVWRYKNEWDNFTERIAFWLDLKNPYITYENSYIETLWWILKKIWQKKLLYKGHKVVPWCPRCETILSSHELAQGYKEVSEPSVFVKFKLKKGQKINSGFKTNNKTYILSWTTTPWTLPGNMALAINPDADYVNIKINKENFILAKERISVVNGPYKIIQEFKGKELIGLSYEPLFKVRKLQSKNSYKIYPADFVDTTEGTGVVHTAIMYGEDDYRLGKKVGLPQYHTVNEQGKFTKDVVGFNGLYVKAKETEEKILNYLENKNLKFRIEQYTHEYPFCWRCGTPLLYYARDSWFIAMSKLRKNLQSANQKINWIPSHLKNGRFGEWLKEAKDWAISRERYWGTPLPIWQCQKCSRFDLVGSFTELEALQKKNKNCYILMRHAEAENNVKNIVSSKLSSGQKHPLTEKGRKEVFNVAEKLKKEKIDLIFSSDFLRARQTAEIIAEQLGINKKKIVLDKRLREINTGIFDSKRAKEYHHCFISLEEKFSKNPPKGENLTEVRERVFKFIQDIEKKNQKKKILIISHEYPLWMLASVMSGWTQKDSINEKGKKKGDFLKVSEFQKFGFRFLPRDKTGQMDVHRPYVDQIIFPCPRCRNRMKRVIEVADVWFDSGAMPFASFHYPFDPKIDFPADYITEGVDQTRGWFYTLLAVAVLLDQKAPYKNVISLGLVLDKYGQKMSKSKGNVVDPWQMIEKYGADAIRWYFYTVNPPGEPKCFNEDDLAIALRQFILIIYNSFVFFDTYGFKKSSKTRKVRWKINVLDQWIDARLNETIEKSAKYLENYEIGEAAKTIEEFVGDVSRWYIRRSRRRFQKPISQRDYKEASETLKRTLLILSKLLAPFMPFFAEGLYKSLKTEKKDQSVHLEDWPKSNKKLIDRKLIKAMTEIRRLASLALAKRAEAGIKVRQPLASLKIRNSKSKIRNNKELLNILADEINIKEIIFDSKINPPDGGEIELDTRITPELREEGIIREFTRMIQDLRQKAGCQPKDTILLYIEAVGNLEKIFNRYLSELKKEVVAKTINFQRTEKFDAELESKIDSEKIWAGIKKVEYL